MAAFTSAPGQVPATASLEKYLYTPLPTATSFRLIEFMPSHGREVSISLSTHELFHAPPFNALSYTWGDPRCPYYVDDSGGTAAASSECYHQATETIRCGGRQFMVGLNLLHALKILSSRCAISATPERYIWIDAICIDQSNLDERSAQVQVMADIYGRAECVISWLGLPDDSTSDAFSVIRRAATVITAPPTLNPEARELRQRMAHLTDTDFFTAQSYEEKLGIRHITTTEWLAWLVLMYRPYFKRAWIVQEVAVARRLVFVCGDSTFQWSEFAAALALVGSVPAWHFLLTQENIGKWAPPGSPERVRFRGLAEWHGTDTFPLAPHWLSRLRQHGRAGFPEGTRVPIARSLHSLLEIHRGTVSTDPRDKVFALLSLADRNKAPFLDPMASTALLPNYHLSIEALYIRLTRLIIRSSGDLSILQLRELNELRALKDLPSWVPDYSVFQFPQPLGQNPGKWEASGNEKWVPDGRSLDDTQLTVRGRRVAAVEKVALSNMNPIPGTRFWGSVFDLLSGIRWDRFAGGRDDGELEPSPGADLEDSGPATTCESPELGSLLPPSPLEVLARTAIRNALAPEFPVAPSEALRTQFLAFAAEKIAIATRSYSEHAEGNPSRWNRLVGRFHQFNIRHFDRSPGERRITPLIAAAKREPPSSEYSAGDLVEALNKYIERIEGPSWCSQTRTDYGMMDGADPLHGKFRINSEASMSCRVMFRTDGGQLLGLGPADTKVADEVWVLSGSKTPVILRPHATSRHCYHFLGETYVYGIMHGQAVKNLPAKDIILE